MSDPYKRTNIFYEEGFEEGFKEGYEESYEEGYKLGQKLVEEKLLAKAKAHSEKAYQMILSLIESPALPGETSDQNEQL